MSITTQHANDTSDRGIPLLAHAAMRFLVPIWIGSGCFVLFEPAPYELLFLAAFGAGDRWRHEDALAHQQFADRHFVLHSARLYRGHSN